MTADFKRFFSSLSVRIWLPFALALILGLAGMTFYQSNQQRKQLRKDAEIKLEKFSELLALNIEISLDFQNQHMGGLEKAVRMAAESDDFEYFALIQKDPANGSEEIISVFPEVKKENPFAVLRPDSSRLLFRRKPVQTQILNGYLIIASSREKMENRIREMQKPLFYIMLSILLVSLLVFFGFARILARPITYLTSVAGQLKAGNYDIEIQKGNEATEILDLNRALSELRFALQEARQKNEDFNRKLEEEIRLRTLDLENTRQRLLEAQEVAILGNYEINLKSGHWMASDTIYAIFGIPKEFSLTNHSWRSFLNQEDGILVDHLFEEAVQSGMSFQRDICLESSEDYRKEKWISITGKAVKDAGNSVQLIRGTIQDISARKTIENEVRRLSLVAEKTSNCVIITDTRRNILWANESTERVTGYTKDEMMGRTPSMFQFEKTSQETKEIIHSKLSNLQEVNVEILNLSKHGREYWVQINIVPLFDDSSRHIGFMAVQTDVTERVAFQQELQLREKNLRDILENSSEMIHTLDKEGRVLWANRSWKEKLGLSDKAIEGLSLMQFLDAKTLEEFQQVIPDLNGGSMVTGLECVFISSDGNHLNLEGRAIPLLEDGEIIGSQAYLHDITKIRKAENDLRQLLQLTQRQNERLRNFTHIVSHNLRSHSSNLSGLISLLNMESPEFRQNVFYSNFEKAVDNLIDVVQNLGEVALIHTEEDKNLQAVNVKKAVDKAIATVFGLAKTVGVQIENKVNDGMLVLADPGYTDSIILNLLTNGIKYRSEERPARITISADDSAVTFIRLDVEDNGVGIDLDRQGRKIFGMYKTFHHHPDARGVGLFLTKNQVEAMGGRIEVKSKVDDGSIFSVFLRRSSKDSV